MNTPTRVVNALAGLLAGFLALLSATSTADTKILPGASCLPRSHQSQYFRDMDEGSSVSTLGGKNVTMFCPILREKTGNAPIRRISVNFLIFGAGEFSPPSCLFRSYGPNGNIVASKHRTASALPLQGGRVTLSVSNLRTVGNGYAMARCTGGHRLLSVFWNE